MANELPTVFEVLTLTEKEKSPVPDSKGNLVQKPQPKDEEEEEDEETTLCGSCGDKYTSDEFWICCDICEKWFHGKCVKITPAKAELIKQYKCPLCSNKS